MSAVKKAKTIVRSKKRGDASPNRHAVIKTSSGLVVNIIEIAAGTQYDAGSGRSVVMSPLCANAQIGDTWNGSAFVVPTPLPLDPAIAERKQHTDDVKAFVASAQLDGFLNLAGDASPAQLTAATKALIRNARDLAWLLRALYAELAPAPAAVKRAKKKAKKKR